MSACLLYPSPIYVLVRRLLRIPRHYHCSLQACCQMPIGEQGLSIVCFHRIPARQLWLLQSRRLKSANSRLSCVPSYPFLISISSLVFCRVTLRHDDISLLSKSENTAAIPSPVCRMTPPDQTQVRHIMRDRNRYVPDTTRSSWTEAGGGPGPCSTCPTPYAHAALTTR